MWRHVKAFAVVPSVSLSVKLRLVGHADYLRPALLLFCSPFWLFTLVLIHNEYRRGCNINKPRSLGRWVYLRIQIKRTMEVTGSACAHVDGVVFSFLFFLYLYQYTPCLLWSFRLALGKIPNTCLFILPQSHTSNSEAVRKTLQILWMWKLCR